MPAKAPWQARLIKLADSYDNLLDSQTGKTRPVLSVAPDQIDLVSLSRDERSLYLTRVSAEADIWMLTLQR